MTRIVGFLVKLAVVSVTATMVTPITSTTAGAGNTTNPSTTAASAQIELTNQDWNAQAGESYHLDFTVAGVDASDVSLVVTAYDNVDTRSELDRTFAGSTVGSVLAGPYQAIALGSLATGTGSQSQTAHYALDLGIECGTGSSGSSNTGSSTASASADTLTIDLSSSNQCAGGGVFPLRLQLVTAQDTVAASLITPLVLSGSAPVTNPLLFDWILPVSPTTPVIPPGPTAALDASQLQDLSDLAGLLGAPVQPSSSSSPAVGAAASPTGIDLTLTPPGWLVSALTHGHQALLSSLTAALGSPDNETLSQSYASVDAGGMVDTGLTSELDLQASQAQATLISADTNIGADSRIWVVPSVLDRGQIRPRPLDDATVEALGQLPGGGTTEMVLPRADVGGKSCGNSTCSAPFALTGPGMSTMQAIAADPGLQSDVVGATADTGVLAAHRLLADLAFIHLEEPGAEPGKRAEVLDSPEGWQPTNLLVQQIEQGLSETPMVATDNLAGIFASIPDGSESFYVDPQPAARALVQPADAAPTAAPPAKNTKAARQHVDAVASALTAPQALAADPTNLQAATRIDQQLLASESSGLTTKQQVAALDATQSAASKLISGISIAGETIRMTSSSAAIEVSVLRSVGGHPIAVNLSLSTDKLVFRPSPGCTGTGHINGGYSGVDCSLVLDHASDSVSLNVTARTTGDISLLAQISTPSGGLVLTHTRLTVQSLSTSAVAVVLTGLATAVLLVWWARTWIKRRRRAG